MVGSYLSDTNAIIAILEGDFARPIELAKAEEAFVSSTIVGELFYGAFGSVRVAENIIRIQALLLDYPSLSCDTTTARIFGKVKVELRSIGKPIPDNDIWIAATALQFDLTLVTRDTHFEGIKELMLLKW